MSSLVHAAKYFTSFTSHVKFITKLCNYVKMSIPPICRNGKARDQKNKLMFGAGWLEKKKKKNHTPPHSTQPCSQGRGEILFFRDIFQKYTNKSKKMIFHLASSDKMSKKLLSFYWDGKTVV